MSCTPLPPGRGGAGCRVNVTTPRVYNQQLLGVRLTGTLVDTSRHVARRRTKRCGAWNHGGTQASWVWYRPYTDVR